MFVLCLIKKFMNKLFSYFFIYTKRQITIEYEENSEMKKICLLILLLFTSLLFAETPKATPIQDPNAPFRLFETTNVWTFIMLDTVTGKMWLIQYDVQGNNRGGQILSDKNLASDKEDIPGRFTLYPTSNVWTFILVDQYEGSTWQVQWSWDKDNAFVIPIY